MAQKILKDKVALITGGTIGIGLATAELFLENGAMVCIAGRRKEEGKKAYDLLRKISRKVQFTETDVTKSDEVEELVSETIKTFGKLDIAFNNAGTEGRFVRIEEMTEEDFNTVINTNLKGVWLSCKYEIEQLKKQGTGGSIVNTSSWLSRGGFRGSSLYSASKAALDGMMRALAIECAAEKIRLNNVQPGYIQTAMFERFFTGPKAESVKTALKKHAALGRFGNPKEVAEVVLWLSSPAAAFVTGESILVDGGLAIPGQR